MNYYRLVISSCLALALCSCAHDRIGYHKIAVAWPPGYENVPDCTPLIAMTGTTVNIKGVNVTTPAGVSLGGGEFHKEQVALQTASDAAQQADEKYTRLCKMLPSYSNDRGGFYRVRDQMFDLIAGTTQVASAVAAQTGQAPPASPSTVPTAAADAAAGTGVDPAKGLANAPAPAAATSSTAPTTAKAGSKSLAKLESAVTKLKQVAKKKAPAKKHGAASATPAT
jgi:hypothetical protein